MSKIFLGRHGETYGPITKIQLESLQASGEIDRYTWLWHAGRGQWEALDPPPPPIAVDATRETTKKSHAPTAQMYDPTGLEVVCHDFRAVMAGVLERVTDSGCEFVARTEAADPEFSTQGKVFLNLLDARTGDSVSVTGRVLEIKRLNGAWRYRIAWNQAPEILGSFAHAAA